MTKICGICMLRDTVDLVPFLVGHYLRIGFDRIHFVDDQSSDGTFELLCSVAKSNPRVTVERVVHDILKQAEVMSAAANQALAAGFNIVFPFDADEFWSIDVSQIRVAATRPGLFVGRWVQFVQDRSERHRRGRGLFSVRYRAPVLADTDPATVESFDRSFVCLTVPKVGFVADSPVALSKGQHALTHGPCEILAQDLELFHVPIRSAREIKLRAERAERVLANTQGDDHWQTRFFRAAMKAGRLDAVWAANSASADGFLDLPSQRIMLIRDSRFQMLMARAWRYMLVRHPSALLGRRRWPATAQYGLSTFPVST